MSIKIASDIDKISQNVNNHFRNDSFSIFCHIEWKGVFMPVRICGIGKGIPAKKVMNDELPASLETSDEWIKSHTGISSRYIVDENGSSATLGMSACKAALKNAEEKGFCVKTEDIDLIICATAAAEYWSFPSNACLIQKELKASNAAAFDISAACSGFIYGLQVARSLMQQMNYRYALVVGAEALSKISDWNDRSTCVLFGDGAGAAVLKNDEKFEESFGSFVLGADGNGCESLYLGKEDHHIHMDGRAVYSFAVGKMAEIIETLLKKENKTIDDIDYVVCHQANERIIQAAAKRLNYPMEKFVLNIADYGNTSSSSIPIALVDMEQDGRLVSGKKLLLAGFGAGLTWGGCFLKW